MPIPFLDQIDVEELGAAGYLRLQQGRSETERLGALLCINALGEPLEFVYNRLELPHPFLWRREDLLRHAARGLLGSLFTACTTTPRILLCLADEVGAELLLDDLSVKLPVGRIDAEVGPARAAGLPNEAATELEQPGLFWTPAAPTTGSPEHQLFDRLASHGLLLEPLERAASGLREVYPAASNRSA